MSCPSTSPRSSSATASGSSSGLRTEQSRSVENRPAFPAYILRSGSALEGKVIEYSPLARPGEEETPVVKIVRTEANACAR
jgi:hypothetical protein